KEFIMAIIGTFTAQTDGFGGTIRTLTLNVNVKLVPNNKEVDNAPDYRVMAGTLEIGAAWLQMAKANRRYLPVSLDDPSLPTTIYASLVEKEQGIHHLIWSRGSSD